MLTSYLQLSGRDFDSLESLRRLRIAGAKAYTEDDIYFETGRPDSVAKVIIPLSMQEDTAAHLEDVRRKLVQYYRKLSEERSQCHPKVALNIVVSGTVGGNDPSIARTFSLDQEFMSLLVSLQIGLHFMANLSSERDRGTIESQQSLVEDTGEDE